MKGQAENTSGATRREFLEQGLLAAAALTGLPRAAMGGDGAGGRVGASDKIALGCIGVGSQGTRVMMDFLKMPDVEVVAVCDVNRESSDYSEWGHGELLGKERRLLNNSGWGADWKGPTCGREPARRLVDAYYRMVRNSSSSPGCAVYNDFRELLDKGQANANLVNDAHLAALAHEHGATVASTDADFARFPGLRWINPLTAK